MLFHNCKSNNQQQFAQKSLVIAYTKISQRLHKHLTNCNSRDRLPRSQTTAHHTSQSKDKSGSKVEDRIHTKLTRTGQVQHLALQWHFADTAFLLYHSDDLWCQIQRKIQLTKFFRKQLNLVVSVYVQNTTLFLGRFFSNQKNLKMLLYFCKKATKKLLY